MAVPALERVATRERILVAGAELFRRQGYAATGLKQVVAELAARHLAHPHNADVRP